MKNIGLISFVGYTPLSRGSRLMIRPNWVQVGNSYTRCALSLHLLNIIQLVKVLRAELHPGPPYWGWEKLAQHNAQDTVLLVCRNSVYIDSPNSDFYLSGYGGLLGRSLLYHTCTLPTLFSLQWLCCWVLCTVLATRSTAC